MQLVKKSVKYLESFSLENQPLNHFILESQFNQERENLTNNVYSTGFS